MSDYLRGVCKVSNSEVYVLDAAGFFAGAQLSLPLVVTTDDVLKEVKDRDSSLRLKYSLEAGKVIVITPDTESVRRIREVAERLGELGRLSSTDIKLLALTHELISAGCRVVVITDDRSVQNVALSIGASVKGIKHRPLRKARRYVYKCPACGHVSSRPGTCEKCGTPLKRVRISK